MRVMITGVCGFVGRFLAHELRAAGHTPLGFDVTERNAPPELAQCLTGNITDREAVGQAVQRLRPDACVHLAGIASPPLGRLNPERMLNTNILGTAHVLEALHIDAPAARFLLASTAYVYGTIGGEEILTEESPLRPIGIYAVSKAAADLMTLAYAQDYHLHAMSARASNHTGPGQSADFVVPAIARQLAEIAAHRREPVIRVGNLDSERSFLDVRDVVRAYRLLIERGRAGQAYNVSGAGRISIRTLLDILCALTGVSPRIEVDPQRYRPTDKTPLLTSRRLYAETGWKPEIPLEETLRAVAASVRL